MPISECMETDSQPQDIDRNDNNIDFDYLLKHQNSSDSDETQYANIPMNTNFTYSSEENSNSDDSTE